MMFEEMFTFAVIIFRNSLLDFRDELLLILNSILAEYPVKKFLIYFGRCRTAYMCSS